jgi:hypothetical protein
VTVIFFPKDVLSTRPQLYVDPPISPHSYQEKPWCSSISLETSPDRDAVWYSKVPHANVGPRRPGYIEPLLSQMGTDECPQLLENRSLLDHDTYSTGWWFQPLWKILVSWGGYSQYMFQTTNQSMYIQYGAIGHSARDSWEPYWCQPVLGPSSVLSVYRANKTLIISPSTADVWFVINYFQLLHW